MRLKKRLHTETENEASIILYEVELRADIRPALGLFRDQFAYAGWHHIHQIEQIFALHAEVFERMLTGDEMHSTLCQHFDLLNRTP